MFSAIKKFINEMIFGSLIHRYETIEIRHGNIGCRDQFEIRIKNNQCRLFHERVWTDHYDVKNFSADYELNDIEKLADVFQGAQQFIERNESKDFGVILERNDGNMKSSTKFYVEPSGGSLHLFSREDSQMSIMTTDGLESSEDTVITYYPMEEVTAIKTVMADAVKRFKTSAENLDS